MLDSFALPAFETDIINDIQSSNFARLELLIMRKNAPAHTLDVSRPRLPRFAKRMLDPDLRKHAFYDLYLRLDARMRIGPDPLAPADSSETLAMIERIDVEPIEKKFIHRFTMEALEQIRSRHLDVLLRFGFKILHGEILHAARYGVWSYHHGDNEFYRGGPSHFWELLERAPLSGVCLQVLTEELDGGLVLCKALFATDPGISVSRNRYVPYWATTDMVIRKLYELHRFGWEHVRQRALPPVKYRGKRKIYRAPLNRDLVNWLGPLLWKKAIRYPLRRERVQHWRIAVRSGGRGLFDLTAEADPTDFGWLTPRPGHFWADPFPVEYDGRRSVFFEEYSYQEGRGWIASAEIQSDGSLGVPVRCLDDGRHHYSYPHVFRDGDTLFMVPETSDAGVIRLYRCREFPHRWETAATLLEGKFVDTTIWLHRGIWWLMTSRVEPDSRAACLLLWYAESPTGPWRFHPANPISTDIRYSRAGGCVFRDANRLIRPSQSGAPYYGHSLSFNEITELSTERYGERCVRTVAPWGGLAGVHTYNRLGDLEFIDGCRMRTPRKMAP